VAEVDALHTRTWGSADRAALLLHGQFGSGATWWDVAPRIARHGYHVVAVDLPGHGESPSDSAVTLDSCVEQIVAACPAAELAIGHSLGSLLLAHCAHRIGVQRSIYIDSPFTYEMRAKEPEYRQRVAEMKATRTLEWLTAQRPHWCEEDRRVEALAAQQFDVDTSLSLMTSLSGVDHRPRRGAQSLIVAPRPSDYFEPGELIDLRRQGFEVEEIEGAGHTVWYGHVDQFMAAISVML
jgi:pimeloyl-ACP methyl ester carboxylesterase